METLILIVLLLSCLIVYILGGIFMHKGVAEIPLHLILLSMPIVPWLFVRRTDEFKKSLIYAIIFYSLMILLIITILLLL